MSDDSGQFAFPHQVIKNDSQALTIIRNLIAQTNITTVVFGQSLNFQRQANPIQAKAEKFATELNRDNQLLVVWEDETWSSRQAERIVSDKAGIDARAAALILQSYLDKKRLIK
mgnify:CR=1 FL=1